MRPGEVHKSAEGWAKFRARTDNGKRKRAAVARPVKVKGAKRGR